MIWKYDVLSVRCELGINRGFALTSRLPALGTLLLLLCAAGAAAQPSAASKLSLMPVPASIRPEEGRLRLSPTFCFALEGYQDDRLKRGLDRAFQRLQKR